MRMPARQFYCTECREWHRVMPGDETTRAARLRHAKEHDQATIMFDRLDLIEFDLFLSTMYDEPS